MLRHRNLRADPLEFGRDLNAARYMDGKRETPNAQVSVTILYDSRLVDPDVLQPLVQSPAAFLCGQHMCFELTSKVKVI